MKSTDETIVDLNLYAALFEDIAAWDEGLRKPLAADFKRLEKTVATRGVSFLMIDMPDACRVFDKALSSGRIDPSVLPHTFGMVVSGSGREFLLSLFEKVFSPFSGRAWNDRIDATSVYFLRQVLSLAKKVRKECSDASISEEVAHFEKIDSCLRSPSLDWDCDEPISSKLVKRRLSFLDGYRSSADLVSTRDVAPRPLLSALDQVSRLVVSQFSEFDWRDVRPKHGPGSVADARRGTDKYLFPHWPSKLECGFPYSYFAQHREDLHLEASLPCSLGEPPARLLAVPKTLKGPRLIASEPIAHQYIQLGMMRWLRENLPRPLRESINFLDQQPSRDACLRASKDGFFATVDLSAASDRLSCWTVERIFQTNRGLLDALHSCRTRSLVNCTGHGPDFFIKLKKFAAMGSGTTFPVQSICYALMCAAALAYEDGVSLKNGKHLRRLFRQIRVFGDDLLLPSRALPSLALLLAHCELKINVVKTHYAGRFRESCGMDAYMGYDVTPVYLRDLGLGNTATALVSWIDVSNNAYSAGLFNLAEYMDSKIPQAQRKLIPLARTDLGCLTLRCYTVDLPVGKTRFNRDLQRDEVLGLSTEVSTVTGRRESYQNLLQYFVEEPDPETNWSAGWLVRNRLRLRKRWVSTHN